MSILVDVAIRKELPTRLQLKQTSEMAQHDTKQAHYVSRGCSNASNLSGPNSRQFMATLMLQSRARGAMATRHQADGGQLQRGCHMVVIGNLQLLAVVRGG